ncbi:MAG: hypothetical protein OEM82_13425 [Acidobacteriota bacterium]|nr:hypothetical protein [Acidobacteriota bacterium]MDH3528967.1 hypothetical protein [Acidobacteriota bacterium]
MNLKRLFLYLLIASVTVSAILGIVVILFGEFGRIESRILGTSVTITCMSLLGLACGANFEAEKLRLVPVAGIAAAIISALFWIVIIWSESENAEYVVKTGLTTTLLAIAFSYASLIAFAELAKMFQWAQYAAYLFAASLVGTLLYVIWIENNPNEELLARVIGALSVSIAALTVLIPIFHKLSGSHDQLEKLDKEIGSLKERLGELEEKRSALIKEEDSDAINGS